MRRAVAIWVLGLLTAVPYAGWYLLFEAPREHYALLIVGILAWVFGYWALVGPLLALAKARAVLRAVERMPTSAGVRAALESREAEDVVVGMIAAENGIPRALAQRVYRQLLERLAPAPGR